MGQQWLIHCGELLIMRARFYSPYFLPSLQTPPSPFPLQAHSQSAPHLDSTLFHGHLLLPPFGAGCGQSWPLCSGTSCCRRSPVHRLAILGAGPRVHHLGTQWLPHTLSAISPSTWFPPPQVSMHDLSLRGNLFTACSFTFCGSAVGNCRTDYLWVLVVQWRQLSKESEKCTHRCYTDTNIFVLLNNA